MSDKSTSFLPSPIVIFFAVAILVFLLTTVICVFVTFILPETYASTTRIKWDSEDYIGSHASLDTLSLDPFFVQTTFQLMQSEAVLSNVITALDLNEKWGKKFNNGLALRSGVTMKILANDMQLAPLRNTKIAELTIYSDDPTEAAQIANAVAADYVGYLKTANLELAKMGLAAMQDQYQQEESKIEQRQAELDRIRGQLKIGSQISDNPSPQEQAYWNEKRELDQVLHDRKLLSQKIESEKIQPSIPGSTARIVDPAQPGRAPVKPNKPVNMLIGIVGGGLLGLIIGTIAMSISLQFRKGNRRNPIPT